MRSKIKAFSNEILKDFFLRLFLFLFFLNLNACIIAIHESKNKLPIENGYNFKCDKKNKFGSYNECREDYIARRMAQRDKYLSTQTESPQKQE